MKALSLMNIRDYQYIVAVAELLHFGNAARRCKITQPTLSMQILKFEEYFNVKIFDRSNKKIAVTEIGEKIVQHAKEILAQHEAIIHLSEKLKDPTLGDLKLGLFPTVGPFLLPKIIPAIHQSYKNLKLFLIEEKTDLLVPKLLDARIDCAVLALPINNDRIEYTKLFFDPFFVALPKKHRLASNKFLSMNDLAGENILLLEDGHCLRSQALEACALVKQSTYQEFQATSLETLRQMVVAGTGITLMPEIACTKTNGITYVPFKDKNLGREIVLAHKKDSIKSATIELVASKILDCL